MLNVLTLPTKLDPSLKALSCTGLEFRVYALGLYRGHVGLRGHGNSGDSNRKEHGKQDKNSGFPHRNMVKCTSNKLQDNIATYSGR